MGAPKGWLRTGSESDACRSLHVENSKGETEPNVVSISCKNIVLYILRRSNTAKVGGRDGEGSTVGGPQQRSNKKHKATRTA